MRPDAADSGPQVTITQTGAPCSELMSSMVCTHKLKVQFSYDKPDKNKTISHTITIEEGVVSAPPATFLPSIQVGAREAFTSSDSVNQPVH